MAADLLLFKRVEYHHWRIHVRLGPRCAQAPFSPRHQQLQGFRARPGEAVRPLQLRWLRDRRRDPLYLDKDFFNLVGRPSVHNWVQYNAEVGKYNVKFERDPRAAAQRGPVVRKTYRYQLQGPDAMKLTEKVMGKPAPELKFFHLTTITIAGKKVNALRHGMVGQPGWELFGPWEDGEAVKAAIVDAGKEFDLRLVGARAYSSNTLRVRMDSFAHARNL